MGSSSFQQRDTGNRLTTRLTLAAIALPALLLVSGCSQPAAGPELADRGSETPSTPTEATEPDPVVVAKVPIESDGTATVPNTPPVQAKVKPKTLDAPPKKLGIGDANPGLQLAKFMKGDPVGDTLTGKVHVVEFWATWCGPCRVGMPHISELQSEYGDDVTFIGVTREKEATVAKFLEAESPDGRTWDEVIKYRIALDDQDWTNTAYMRAAGQNGIPCAFVVGRDGVVEWIGHPRRIDEPLKQILDGNWDRDAAIAEFKQQERIKEMSGQLSRLARSQDWDGALELLDELEKEMGKSKAILSYRLRLLDSAGMTEKASEVRAELVQDAWDDASALNELAWKTATSGNATDLELALKAAERASQLRNDEDAAILDTVARCYYELGKLDQAIRWQRRAVEHNEGHQEIDAALERYLSEKSATEESESPPEDSTEDGESPEDAGATEKESAE